MKSIVTRYVAANDETVKAEELKADILANRTLKVVSESGELMEAAVSNAQKNAKISKDEVAFETARANWINMVMAIVVVIAIVDRCCFPSWGSRVR